jgi:hypothetical protein
MEMEQNSGTLIGANVKTEALIAKLSALEKNTSKLLLI